MKKVLITGCNGQLGRALNQLLDGQPVEIINTDVDTLDICDAKQVLTLVQKEMPDTIINCAAHTAVDKCETDQENARRINALGPKNLASAAKAVNAQIVQVSTDYVFDGKADKPYIEGDTPCPQSVYGSTKLEGERAVSAATDKYYIVRTAWLYGDGNNFVKTMLRLASERDTITVVKDQLGSPTSALELARMILHIVDSGEYGIYHGTCEGIASWYEFAKEIFRLAKSDVNLIPVTTDEYPATVAKRPAYSVLENQKLNAQGSYRMKEWKEALAEYMAGMGYQTA
ncbi:MAG: dTDP-4-dehydrorhamnose reductase [Clostridiaceae bacterium]|nr:dTDP-4-dehydrorhamnose reductase [Clostridiaceae bacterium]